MSGWRVWFAFESRPGVMVGSGGRSPEYWYALLDVCRKADGSLDHAEYMRWMELVIETGHQQVMS